jgi:hypothetical protein
MLPPTATTNGGLGSELITKSHECHVILTDSITLSILMRIARTQRQRRRLEKRVVAGEAPQGGREVTIVSFFRIRGLPGLLKSVALRLVSFDERRDL